MNTPHSSSRVFAVIPAAGRGTRMQGGSQKEANRASSPVEPTSKQLCELAGQPMLMRVIRAIQESRASGCVVVANPPLAPALETWSGSDDEDFQYVVNPRPESEMIESIQLGLQKAGEMSARKPPGISHDGFLICPGDHPCITSVIIDHCIETFEKNPSRIVIATHAGRRGHPMILPADLAFDVLSWPPTRGLNELRKLHPERVTLVEVDDPGILIDVDTPDDLHHARDHLRSEPRL